MILLGGVAVGLLLGMACGGSPRWLSEVRLVGETAFVLLLVVSVLLPRVGSLSPALTQPVFAMWVFAMAALLILSALNARSPGFPLMAGGVFCNLLGVVANAGMPVSPRALSAAGYSMQLPTPGMAVGDAFHLVAGPVVRLAILGDVLPLPGPTLVHSVLSVGDVLLAVGVAVLIASSMGSSAPNRHWTHH